MIEGWGGGGGSRNDRKPGKLASWSVDCLITLGKGEVRKKGSERQPGKLASYSMDSLLIITERERVWRGWGSDRQTGKLASRLTGCVR